MKTPTIAIFDIGKTNKKLFLFDENYQIVWEKSAQFDETLDEDGEPCEDLWLLTKWVKKSWVEVQNLLEFEVKALNFSTYGASFVHIDRNGNPLTPLYNYLKTYPEDLKKQFYDTYGGEENFAVKTASPVMGSLNSGMQIYRIKHQNPSIFRQIVHSLHLPQYLHFLITQEAHSDITSIGCHTNLWDFQKNNYHEWVEKEGLTRVFAPISPSLVGRGWGGVNVGIGLHDSSAALIPYLATFHEPFVLISTGTWCITLNAFNDSPLTFSELQEDCLCYLTYKGNPVKASRLFAGYEHEQETKRLAEHFGVAMDYYKGVKYDKNLSPDPSPVRRGEMSSSPLLTGEGSGERLKSSNFKSRNLSDFKTYEAAYHALIFDIMQTQIASCRLVLDETTTKRIFVDGGFSKNPIYMNLLAEAFPTIQVSAASVAQATALGAAMAMHAVWNTKPMSNNLVELKQYSPTGG